MAWGAERVGVDLFSPDLWMVDRDASKDMEQGLGAITWRQSTSQAYVGGRGD